MKTLRKLMSFCLTAAFVFSMVTAANAYTYKDAATATVDKTTNASGTTYVYDFKSADGTYMAASEFYSQNGNAANHSNTADGYKFVSSTGAGSSTASGYKGFLHDFYIADPDFYIGHNVSHKLKAEAGHIYEITVEWMSANGGKYIYLTRDWNGSTFTGETYTMQRSSNSSTANTRMTSTFVVDGDASCTYGDSSSPNAGAYLGFCTNSGTTYFYMITVTVYDKEAFTVADKQLTVNFDNGLDDIYVPRVDVNYAGTIEIAEDPNNSGRGNVLKMTTTKTSGTTFQFGLAATPGLGDYRGTNDLPGVDGYQVTLGNTYRISYDAYCGDYDEGISDSYACYLSTQAGIGASGNKEIQSKTDGSNHTIATLQSGAGNGEWIHVEYTITANSPTYGGTYLLIGLNAIKANTSTAEDAKDYAAVVYFDNIVVTDITDKASKFVSNAKRSIRAEGTDNGAYVSAGIRFRGEIATATAEAAEEVGFIVAPEQYVTAYTGSTAWYDMSAGSPALATAQTVDTTETIYGTNGSNTQYQLLLRGLTRQNETVDLKNTYFTVMMYLKNSDGSYTYLNVATSSYREVQNAYIANDQSNDSKY